MGEKIRTACAYLSERCEGCHRRRSLSAATHSHCACGSTRVSTPKHSPGQPLVWSTCRSWRPITQTGPQRIRVERQPSRAVFVLVRRRRRSHGLFPISGALPRRMFDPASEGVGGHAVLNTRSAQPLAVQHSGCQDVSVPSGAGLGALSLRCPAVVLAAFCRWRTRLRLRIRVRTAVDGAPGCGRLELCRHPQQQILASERRDQLDADRQHAWPRFSTGMWPWISSARTGFI